MNMSELKPCPFCGAISHLNRDSSGWNKIKANHSDDCPLLGNNLLTWSSGEIVPIVNKWNQRTSDNTITEQEKVINELVDKIQLNTEILTAIMERKPIQGSDYHAISCTIKNNELLIAKHKQSKGE